MMARKGFSDTSRPQAEEEDGEGGLMPIEAEKVDEAVRYLNERTILSGLELAKEVGEYVLSTFFDGDYAKFANVSRSKSTSFRALLAREDLLLGNATLYSFVRISHQLKSLPADVVPRLTLAHHRALLPLPDPEAKVALAQQAVGEGWPSVLLGEQVRKLLPKTRKGRRPLPSFAKAIRRVAKALDPGVEEEVTPEEIEMLGSEQALELTEQVEESLACLERLKKSLVEVLDTSESPQ